MPTFFEALNELMAAETPLVTVTVVDTTGSVPQNRGAKMIVTREGRAYGTVGGGKVETKAITEAQEMLRAQTAETSKFVQWNLNKDVGMTCGGVIRLYFEAHNAGRWNIVVFGAGHVAQALVSLLVNLDCHVTCIDPRPEWIEKLPRSPKLETIVSGDMPSMVRQIPDGSFVVLMTMGHATDTPVLAEILRTRELPYVGVIGSKSKAVVIRRDLEKAGVSADRIATFHCPIGLSIGSRHPYEIAVSIVAQMIQERDRFGERAGG